MKHLTPIHFSLVATAFFGSSVATMSQTFEEIYSFRGYADGYSPRGALVQATDGNFYGTTTYGGQPTTNCPACGYGTVFRMTPSGGLTTIAWFNGSNGAGYPAGALVEASDGHLYGTTRDGGIFRVTLGGTITSIGGGGGITDELTDLIQGHDGYLYGVDTYYGDTFWISLDWRTQAGVFVPGASGGVVQATDGNFYGVTVNGGTNHFGSAYRMAPGGVLTTIVSFSRGPGWYAVWPYGRMRQAIDGNLYGVAAQGYYGEGAIFKLSLDGTLTTFASFNTLNGRTPNDGLIEANDGNFYGTTIYGGTYCCPGSIGTAFKMTPTGQITTVVSFTGQFGKFPGENPLAGLVQGSDGNLYGTCAYGGSQGGGNIFRIIMPGPQLNLRRSGDQLILSWRTNHVGFTLESAEDLRSENWTAWAGTPTSASGQYWATNLITAGAAFFRLKK